ncbi:PREDICTED: signal recognition particle subunit SRP72 isoform X2 [Nicrophorus vespilloides]|nr:PREDICTED: signal recognition particle subunit SRP72 isoform X2 [Nicrophorus vespilloides]XP_017787211.1 PREDICTED: signal recognition particle subunit SRP72 isoform X2 [Nicrophorus vespilloides]
MPFEKAYCLYRTNNPQDALNMLNDVPNPDHRILELKAQVLYRLEQFDEAANVYQNIFRNAPDDEYEEERQTNLGAVVSSLNQRESDKFTSQLQEETYEMCYNKALMYVKQENFVKAEKLLKTAEVMLKEAFEEDGATEEETDIELANVRVLQAFCCHKQGRLKEAHQLYLGVLKLKLDDIALSAVASNNVVVINKDQNVFDSKKKMKVATNDALIHKLPSSQRKTIAVNNAIFKYYCNQHEQSNKLCNSLVKEWPDLETKLKILNAINDTKIDSKANPVQSLKSATANTPEDELVLKLTAVHLLLTQGKKEDACTILETLGDNRFKPGIIGALLTIYMHLGKEDVALKIYEEAIEWYKANEKSGKDLTSFFRQAGDFHIRSGRPQVAAKSFEQILINNAKDSKTTAQLVIACSQFDNNKAIEVSSKLGSIADLEKDVDVKILESNIWLNAKKSATGVTNKTESPGSSDNAPKKKKHRKRKGPLPKNYDSSATPDPERWLPKYERTGYRKKKDRRVKEIIKGSQGTAAGQSDQFDYTKYVTEDDGASVPEPSPMQKLWKKGGNNQKKKNKRR